MEGPQCALTKRTADKTEALNISLRISGCLTPGGQDCEETDSRVLSSLPPPSSYFDAGEGLGGRKERAGFLQLKQCWER